MGTSWLMDSFQQIDHSDSRYAMKQRDIAATVAKMGAVTEKRKADWEAKFNDTLIEATEEAVLCGGGDRSILHSGDKFRSNYERWIKSLKRS